MDNCAITFHATEIVNAAAELMYAFQDADGNTHWPVLLTFAVVGSDVPDGWVVRCGVTTNTSLAPAVGTSPWADGDTFWSTEPASSADRLTYTQFLTVPRWNSSTAVWYDSLMFDMPGPSGPSDTMPSVYTCAAKSTPDATCDPASTLNLDTADAYSCFPPDAPVRRLTAGGALETVAVSALSLGDFIECVAPPAWDAPTGAVGNHTVCQVYYVQNVQQPGRGMTSYIDITYADADGAIQTARATPQHLVFMSDAAVSATAPSATPPTGGSKNMGGVVVGDLITLHDAARGFYTTPVLTVASSTDSGAFSPILLRGGMPLVYDALFFSFANMPLRNAGMLGNAFLDAVHAPVWQAAERSLALGCLADPSNTAKCVCLDAASPCVRMGEPFAALPAGIQQFDKARFAQQMALIAAGRAVPDLAGAVANITAGLAAGVQYTIPQMLALEAAFWHAPA